MLKLRAAKSSPFGWDHTDCSVLPFSPNDPDGARGFPIGCEGALTYEQGSYPKMCTDEVTGSDYKWYKACCKVEGKACIPQQRWGADIFADENRIGVPLASKTYLSACRKYGGSGECQHSSKHVFDKVQYGGCACHESQIPQVYADLNYSPIMCSVAHMGAGNNFGSNRGLQQAWCGTLKGACKDGETYKEGDKPGGTRLYVDVTGEGYYLSAEGRKRAFLNVEEISYQACGGNQDGANVYTGYVAQLATHKSDPGGTRIPEPCAPGYRNALSKHECKRLTAAAGLTFVDNPDDTITTTRTHASGCVKVAVRDGQDDPFAKGKWDPNSTSDVYDDRVIWVKNEPTEAIGTAFRLCGKIGSQWDLDERAIRETLYRQQNDTRLGDMNSTLTTTAGTLISEKLSLNSSIESLKDRITVVETTNTGASVEGNSTAVKDTDFLELQTQVKELEKVSKAAKIRNKSWLNKLLLDLNKLLNHRCTDPDYPIASVDETGEMQCRPTGVHSPSNFKCPVGCANKGDMCVEPIREGRDRQWGCDILPTSANAAVGDEITPLGCPGAVLYGEPWAPYYAMCTDTIKTEGKLLYKYKWYWHCCDWKGVSAGCQPKAIRKDDIFDNYQTCTPPTGSLAATVSALQKQIDKVPSSLSATEKDYAKTNHTHDNLAADSHSHTEHATTSDTALTDRVTTLETQTEQAAPLAHVHNDLAEADTALSNRVETLENPSATANAGVTAKELEAHKESIKTQLEQLQKQRSDERTKLQNDLLDLTTHTYLQSGEKLLKFIEDHEELQSLTADGSNSSFTALQAAIGAQIKADQTEEDAAKTILDHINELGVEDLEALREKLNTKQNDIEDIATGVLTDAAQALQAKDEELEADLKELKEQHGGTAEQVAEYIKAHAELKKLSNQHLQTFDQLRAAIKAEDSAVVTQLDTIKTELDNKIQINLNDISATLIKIGKNADDIAANKTAIVTNAGNVKAMRADLEKLYDAVCQPTNKDFTACRAVTILQRQLAALTELDAAQAAQLAEAVSTLENDLYQERGVYSAKLWGWGLVVGIVILITVGLLGYYLWSRYRRL